MQQLRTPLAPGKAADLAADEIRRQIQEGFLAPGQRLIEAELMARLPVGRSTLREAFLKLAGEGLVELQHQRGACVRRMTRSDLAELFQLRECLEGFAAGLAASQVTVASHRAWLAEARRVWLGDEVLNNELSHMENNVPLHDGIVAMAGNRRLMASLKVLELPAYRLQFLRLLDREQRTISAREHLDIIDAILAGKAARADKLMRAHVRRAGQLAQGIPGLA
ncbi:MAG: GntR family transcriptional regulator [Proteobacteria bacterium]|jgi:DNA-binding GntR family transcriptional regulator|nr:GntR family transcriptional regulator [Pseudomonadota bacterium]